MPNTPVYTDGVKYIKIAKQDSGSVDNSIELQNLTDIRIKFSDISNPVQYNVASIAEYSTYYLYTIFPLNVTSSADQEILDYTVSASSNSFTAVGGTLPSSFLRITDYQINTNPLNYLNPGPPGTYTLGNTPNITLNVTNSISLNASVGITLYFLPVDANSYPIFTGLIQDAALFYKDIPSSAGVVSGTLTGSFTPIEGNSYGFFLRFYGSVPSSFTSSLLITQSFAPEASNYDIVVLEPYTGYNFYNSDCNVIQNNVDVNNINPLYMDVDFNGGQIVAQNQSAILSGNAPRAQVQPWNYSYYSQISGRYVGKQQNAIALNVYTSASQFITASAYGYTGSWPGDSISPTPTNPNSRRILERSSPGNVVIQWLDSCIYEMNWGGPGYPENVNGGGLSMGNIYLVGNTRDDVAIIKPGTDIYYDILEKTFPSGSPAFQYQYTNSPTLPTQLNITYPSLTLPSATYYLASNYIQPTAGPLILVGGYVTGSVGGGNPPPPAAAGTGSVVTASWAELNFDPIYSASVASDRIYKVTVSASVLMPGFAVNNINNFLAQANGLTYANQLTQFTTYNSTTDSISFFFTGAAGLGPWNTSNPFSNTSIINARYSIAQSWGTFYPTGSPSFMNGTPYIYIGDNQSTYIPSADISINGDLFQNTSSLIENTYFLDNLNDGGRYFVSFYSGSGTTTNLTGGLPSICDTTLQQVGFPFEIDQYISPGPGDNYITFKNAAAIKYWFETGSAYSSSISPIPIGEYSGSSNAGILVTKAQYPTNGLTIFGLPNSNFAGAGKGYILSQYPKQVITQNIDYILKTYGNQPT
jgi:hypothetical protein